jgi:hypothetical protein
MKEFIQLKSIEELSYGDSVRHVNHEKGILTCIYIVTGNFGDRATAVDTVDITNPSEWEVLREVRDKREHDWQWYMNGTFCKVCGELIGTSSECKGR